MSENKAYEAYELYRTVMQEMDDCLDKIEGKDFSILSPVQKNDIVRYFTRHFSVDNPKIIGLK